LRAQVARARQHGRNLGARENLRQPLQLRGQRNLERLAVQPEHGAVQEAKCAAVLVDAGAREVALAHQMQQVLLHLLGCQRLGTAPVVPRQARHGLEVALLSACGHAAQHQCVEHALSKRGHHRSPRSARAHARIDQGTATAMQPLRREPTTASAV